MSLHDIPLNNYTRTRSPSPDKHSLKNPASSTTEIGSDHLLVEILSDYNAESVLNKKAVLTLECLVRLRKYQMIEMMEANPEGGYMATLSLPNPARIVQTQWK